MAKLNDKYPGDLDVMALYSESLMVLNPWAMWTKEADGTDIVPANDSTLVVKAILERVSDAVTRPVPCLTSVNTVQIYLARHFPMKACNPSAWPSVTPTTRFLFSCSCRRWNYPEEWSTPRFSICTAISWNCLTTRWRRCQLLTSCALSFRTQATYSTWPPTSTSGAGDTRCVWGLSHIESA